ncbi:hypothetical protein DdX_16157 [Ditylenchus destructor]|uniref:Uncharacterized protein n=1 Tax=Ditylenchus destructor TaxID=166010 RepID=A0AAD4R072_9BILA|nr:hypothetical protein DdX_16157 [Ditylenchus destructor]
MLLLGRFGAIVRRTKKTIAERERREDMCLLGYFPLPSLCSFLFLSNQTDKHCEREHAIYERARHFLIRDSGHMGIWALDGYATVHHLDNSSPATIHHLRQFITCDSSSPATIHHP